MSVNNPGDRAGWFWVCIEDLEGGVISGSLQNHYIQEPLTFCGLDHFLQLAEGTMDETAFPQADVRRRDFTDPERRTERRGKGAEGSGCLERRRMAELVCPRFEARRGKYGAFDIRIFYRRSASWQGEAVYLDGVHRVTLMFRSALELICAMRHVLLSPEKSEDVVEDEWHMEAELCAVH